VGHVRSEYQLGNRLSWQVMIFLSTSRQHAGEVPRVVSRPIRSTSTQSIQQSFCISTPCDVAFEGTWRIKVQYILTMFNKDCDISPILSTHTFTVLPYREVNSDFCKSLDLMYQCSCGTCCGLEGNIVLIWCTSVVVEHAADWREALSLLDVSV
jgi:hypothetical protein